MKAITYTEHELMPGKKLFRCEKLSASLTTQSCAAMWTEANGENPPERLHRCQGCPIGAMHAGAGDVAMNPIRGREMCCRCGRTDLRIISGLVCVSCKNREYEAKKGKNSKGAPPKHHPGMGVFGLRYQVEGESKVIRREATSVNELMIQLLRDEPKRVTFGMGRQYVAA